VGYCLEKEAFELTQSIGVESPETALKMGKVSATGSLQLLVGTVLSSVILAIGTLIVARLISPDQYGLYSIALIPSTTMSLFCDWGVNRAMTKYIAQSKAQNKEEDIKDIITAGLAFEILVGLALSFISLLLASTFATTFFNRQELAPLIGLTSIAIFSGVVLASAQSIFIGFERMELNSITIILQSLVKCVAQPLLILFIYGALGATLGYVLSFLTAGIIGLAILYLTLFRDLKRKTPRRPKKFKILKLMLKYGFPMAIANILSGALTQFNGFIMAFYCSDVAVGNYRAAVNFAVLLVFFTFPISTVLFPVFAKIDPHRERKLMRNVFASSVKYTAMLLVPATLAIMVLSKPMISTLFGDQWVYAPVYLSLYVTSNLLVIFGSLSVASCLTGLGETTILMTLSGISLLLGIPLAFLLVPIYGIVGAIIGNILAGLPSFFLGLQWVWKHYEARPDFYSSFRILAASCVAAAITYLLVSQLHSVEWIRLGLGGTIFILVYITAAPSIGALTQTDINNLRNMIPNMGFLSKLLNSPLTFAEKVLTITSMIRK
jgi:O-antigen/teichoic acid export membrane protein